MGIMICPSANKYGIGLVTLQVSRSGHTNNRYDRTYGLGKKHMRTRDFGNPFQMNETVHDC